MKRFTITLPLLMLCVATYAQTPQIDSIKKYLRFEKDKFSNDITLVPIDTTLRGKTKDGFIWVIQSSIDVTDKRYNNPNFKLSFGSTQFTCVGESFMDFLFLDESKARTANDLQSNCVGVFISAWVPMSGKYKLLESLANAPLQAVRLNTTIATAEIYLTKAQSTVLNNEIKWFKYYYDNFQKLNKLKLYNN